MEAVAQTLSGGAGSNAARQATSAATE